MLCFRHPESCKVEERIQETHVATVACYRMMYVVGNAITCTTLWRGTISPQSLACFPSQHCDCVALTRTYSIRDLGYVSARLELTPPYNPQGFQNTVLGSGGAYIIIF